MAKLEDICARCATSHPPWTRPRRDGAARPRAPIALVGRARAERRSLHPRATALPADTNMSDSVLQGLRRRLPVTRTKFDWDKLAVAKLAGDLQRAAGMK